MNYVARLESSQALRLQGCYPTLLTQAPQPFGKKYTIFFCSEHCFFPYCTNHFCSEHYISSLKNNMQHIRFYKSISTLASIMSMSLSMKPFMFGWIRDFSKEEEFVKFLKRQILFLMLMSDVLVFIICPPCFSFDRSRTCTDILVEKKDEGRGIKLEILEHDKRLGFIKVFMFHVCSAMHVRDPVPWQMK